MSAAPVPSTRSTSPSSRSFSANLKRNMYQCFRCDSSGNQLELYAAVTGLRLFDATEASVARYECTVWLIVFELLALKLPSLW